MIHPTEWRPCLHHRLPEEVLPRRDCCRHSNPDHRLDATPTFHRATVIGPNVQRTAMGVSTWTLDATCGRQAMCQSRKW